MVALGKNFVNSKLATIFLAGFLVGGLSVQYIQNHVSTEGELEISAEETYVLPAATPYKLRIPAVDITAPFETPLDLTDEGGVVVPEAFDAVGWYKYSPTPGELGPSVVLGHVDSNTGPAIFWNLKNLKVGEEIYIDREDGTTATFSVTKLENHTQGSFPTSKVYSDIDHAGLRLITCSGLYNYRTLRYSHNLIVYAALVQPTIEKTE